jgi:hypothetical protein
MDTETLGINTEREEPAGEVTSEEIKKAVPHHKTEQLEIYRNNFKNANQSKLSQIKRSANFYKKYVLHTEQHSFFPRPISDEHLHDGKKWHRL